MRRDIAEKQNSEARRRKKVRQLTMPQLQEYLSKELANGDKRDSNTAVEDMCWDGCNLIAWPKATPSAMPAFDSISTLKWQLTMSSVRQTDDVSSCSGQAIAYFLQQS